MKRTGLTRGPVRFWALSHPFIHAYSQNGGNNGISAGEDSIRSSDQVRGEKIRVGTLDGVIEFDAFLLSEFLHKIVVELLLVS